MVAIGILLCASGVSAGGMCSTPVATTGSQGVTVRGPSDLRNNESVSAESNEAHVAGGVGEAGSGEPIKEDGATIGISVQALEELVQDIGKKKSGGAQYATWEVCKYYVKPLTSHMQVSYVDFYAASNPGTSHIGTAQVFVSHAWNGNFK